VNKDSFYIGGQWVRPSSSRRFSLLNASTAAPLASVPEAVEADVDAAVGAARAAFDGSDWSRMPAQDRAAVMGRFCRELAARSEDLARAVSVQNGMPIAVSTLLEGQFSIGVLDYYAQLVTSPAEQDVRPSQAGRETLVERPPVGVVAAVVPWNFPVTLAFSKIAPAMAAGCTLVIKPSPGTVLDSYVVAEAAHAAEVPAGVLNWVPAEREIGAYLVAHKGVDKVAFTGSTTAGRAIARVCGELLRPVTLELGGKSAAILLDDFDLGAFLQGIPFACMLNNGQACYNATRVLVPSSRYDEVVDAVAAMVSALTVGDAMSPATHVGPMASAAHRERVEGYIAQGKGAARLVAGGGRPRDAGAGWFVEPTVFADVDNASVIAQEEIFGPVLTLLKYETDEQAVRIANASQYGLGGSVWSTDSERALRVARAVDSGTVGINGYMPALGSPFGGVKSSGIGREFGPEALAAYQQYKSIYVMG
jgi:aldehyde dehydrogenase (NAD+)